MSSQLLLTFLLNACWQIALIAALASLGSWLLRNSVARYQHWVWGSALCLAFLVPAITSSQTLFDTRVQTTPAVVLVTESVTEGISLFVPISFHPAAALLRRRVKQTRELCCDELVAERILNAEVYARSLVKLAGSAPPLRRLSVTTTVGIADADILEARIMSLLRKPNSHTRWKKLLLVAVALLIAVPCVAAATFAMRFDVKASAQDPAAQEKERKEKEVLETKMRRANEMDERKMKMAQDPAFREEVERKERVEMEMREARQAALIRLAKINMDQAIQIATSQTPGKVLLCSLEAKGWEEPGKLAKDGIVFYHVMIADEATPGAAHVWVNAIDGSIIKTEKELPRKQREP